MRSLSLLLPLTLAALPFLACSSDKNHAAREEAHTHDPGYAESQIDFTNVDSMKKAPISVGTPDPGSKPVDMAAAQKDYQFAWLWDLEGEGKAWATFTYDDNTSDFVVPLRTPSSTGYGQGGWEPTPDAVPWPGGPANAVRFKGGPYTEYGGGVGISLRTISNAIQDSLVPRLTNTSIQLLEQTPSKEFPDPSAGAYDLTSWEGLAIWVRRGPDGQASMRLALTERNSAEDLNSSAVRDGTSMASAMADPLNNRPPGISEGKYCRRWRICGCSGGTPCTQVPGSADDFRCYDPAEGQPSGADLSDYIKFPHCGAKRCKDGNSSTAGPDQDPLFVDRSCNAAVTSDGRSDMYCYDPARDPKPPSKRERCGNPFSRPIRVSTDWELIKVPFSELRQADEGQVAPDMDLASVKQVAMTYSGGWIDFWIANIGFYRKTPRP